MRETDDEVRGCSWWDFYLASGGTNGRIWGFDMDGDSAVTERDEGLSCFDVSFAIRHARKLSKQMVLCIINES